MTDREAEVMVNNCQTELNADFFNIVLRERERIIVKNYYNVYIIYIKYSGLKM